MNPGSMRWLMLAFVLACTTARTQEDSAVADESGEASEESSGGPSEDLPTDGGECQLVADDCMDPQLKCMPWTDSPGPPAGTRCCDLDPEPVSLGERCHVQDDVFSCRDDCPAHSMCLVDDVDALAGLCQSFCDVEAADSCPTDELCMPLFEDIGSVSVPLCLARCDPLQQDCESKGRSGWACVPTGPQAPAFACLPATGPSAKLEYESCMVASDCTPGLMCLPAELVLGCEGLTFCCTRYCDTNEANACTMGNECVSMGSTVPGLEHVGICAEPG